MNGYRVPPVLWAIAALQVLLAIVASIADWPAQFAADGSSPDGTLQWIVRGSAVSAPLTLIVGLVVVGLLATRQGALGTAGDVLAVLLGVAMLIGGVGEAVVKNHVDTPRVVPVGSAALSVALAAVVVWAVTLDLRTRQRARRALTATSSATAGA
jgi:hypothetical protein